MAGGARDSLFGEIVVSTGLCTGTQVEKCLQIQEQYRQQGMLVPRLGEILAARQYLAPEQVKAVLESQHRQAGNRFGEVASRLKLCLAQAVEEALRRQAKLPAEGKPHQRLGELLVEVGALAPHHVKVVLGAMGLRPEPCPSCGELVNLELGAAEYFYKPNADPSSLRRAIRYSIERARVVRELTQSEEAYRALVETSPDGITELPTLKRHLASHLNLTSETFSRTLRRLVDAGLIAEQQGNRVRLLDREALGRVAEGMFPKV